MAINNHFEDLKNKKVAKTTTFEGYQKEAQAFKEEQDARALESYNQTLASNKLTANKAYQNADILNQKLSKYIPNYVANQGINGGLALSYQNKANTDVQNMYAQVSSDMQDLNNQAKATYDAKLDNNLDAYNQALATGRTQTLNDYNTALQDILSQEGVSDTQKKEAIGNLWDSYADVLGEYKGQAETETLRYYNALEDDTISGINAVTNGDNKTLKYNDDISVTYNVNDTNAYDLKDYQTVETLRDLLTENGTDNAYQKAYSTSLANKLLNGEFKNGDLIETNYGAKASGNGGDKSMYVYMDGKLYPITRDGDGEASRNKVAETLPDKFEYKWGMIHLKSGYTVDAQGKIIKN